MEKKLLELPFDIHTGGIDLKFPHHEDEIAQSKAGYDIEPTNYWCHNEFLEVEGTKMSKSLGNFFTLRQLEEKGVAPIDVRYAMFSVHYRTKYNFTFNGISAARKARLRLQDYIYSIFDLMDSNEKISEKFNETEIKSDKIKELKNAIIFELANDLHTPKALAHLFSFINSNSVNVLNETEKRDFLSLIYDLNNIFRAWNFEKNETENKVEIPQNIIELAEQRLQAKQNKNFAEADRLRNEITVLGYQILDTKAGFDIKKM
jgi:cysteinyl-tRNA synthetase